MKIGLLKEVKIQEHRVALIPEDIRQLTKNHTVYVENNAGLDSGFSNKSYQQAGAQIVDKALDIWNKVDLVIKVKEPQPSEYNAMRENQIVFTYFHFAGSRSLTKACLDKKIIALAYETLETNAGLPLLTPMSAIAGKMAAIQAAKYLEKTFNGKGLLISGLITADVSVPPANALILGAGVVGTYAMNELINLGAKVTILDINQTRLDELKQQYGNKIITRISSNDMIKSQLPDIDIVIGAVLLPGGKAPQLISKADLSLMQKGSVLVDVAIDQGGCFETSYATTHDDPIYIVDGIVHYCVANLPGAVCRTSSQALSHSTIPYIQKLCDLGLGSFLNIDKGHQSCLNMRQGKLTHPALISLYKDL